MGALGQQDLNSGIEGVRRFGPRVPSNAEPNGQVKGDLWYDLANFALKVWNGTDWVGVASGTGQAVTPGMELYHPSGTPFIDFHRAASPAGDSYADYNVRLINEANNDLRLMGTGGTAALRVGSTNGEVRASTWIADGNYAMFGSQLRAVANNSHYAIIVSGTSDNVYFGGTPMTFRLANNGTTVAVMDANGYHASLPVQLDGSRMYTKTTNDAAHMLAYYSPGDFFEYFTWNEHKFWSQAVHYGSIGANAAGVLANVNWVRMNEAAVGWYNNTEGCGLRASNVFGSSDSVDTQHNETQIVGRKLSQAGWATAGIESFSEVSNGVPYMTNHANGCCTSSWRKDANQSYMVVVNSGGGCDWVYAANHPVCSEEGRKHNISITDDYGLKTLRGLNLKRFQYTPSDESEIWAWESWKHDRERGVWTNPPNEHMNWDTWHIGYMAEEMANLVPEIVGYYSDGKPKGIDYGNLVVVVIEAVKELANRLDNLEARMMKSGV